MSRLDDKFRLLGSVLWAFAGRGGVLVLGFVTAVILARVLNQDDFGLFVFVVSIVGVASLLGTAGAPQASVRLIARALAHQDTQEARAVLQLGKRVAGLGILLITVVAAVFLLGWDYQQADSALSMTLLLAISLWISLFAVQFHVGEVFRGYSDIRRATLFGGLLSTTIATVCFALALLLGWPLSFLAVVLIYVAALVLSVAVAFQRLRPELVAAADPLVVSNVKAEFRSNRMNLWSVSVWTNLSNQAPILIGGFFFALDDLSVLGVVFRLVVILTIGPMVIDAFIQPLLSRYAAKGELLMASELARGSAFVSGVFALLLAIVFILFGESLLTVVFGPAFSEGAVILAYITIARLVQAVAGPAGAALAMSGQQQSLKVITRASAVLQLLSCVVTAMLGELALMVLLLAVIIGVEKVLLALAAKRLAGIATFASASAFVALLRQRKKVAQEMG